MKFFIRIVVVVCMCIENLFVVIVFFVISGMCILGRLFVWIISLVIFWFFLIGVWSGLL